MDTLTSMAVRMHEYMNGGVVLNLAIGVFLCSVAPEVHPSPLAYYWPTVVSSVTKQIHRDSVPGHTQENGDAECGDETPRTASRSSICASGYCPTARQSGREYDGAGIEEIQSLHLTEYSYWDGTEYTTRPVAGSV